VLRLAARPAPCLADEARSGFEIEALYGWFDRCPFDADSAEQVWVAQRL